MTTERDWKRLGHAFAEARKAANLTQVEVAERLSVTRTPIQAIERGVQPNGKPFAKVSATMRAYARLVGWTEGSPDLILQEQEPEPATQPVPEAAEAKFDLPPAVDRELRSGRTLDSTVVHLSGEGDEDDVRIVVVLKGAQNISEEEIDRRYEQWRRTRRHVQAIPGETDPPQDN
jgi:transcriptional regulator with XRE-family HTH domain